MSTGMKTLTGVLLMGSALLSEALAETSNARAWEDRSLPADERARSMVDAMSLDEQISLLRTESGFGLLSLGVPLPPTVPESMRKYTPKGAIGSAGFVAGIPRVGMPAQQMSDASLGVANLGGFVRRGDEATSLPASLALAATFDPALAREAGRMVGAEAHAKGFNVQLAGGVNLTREPRNGRNFEYAGEDPLLSGIIIGEQIAGIQSQHVIATTKHFALNSQETGRFVHDAVIDEAALRESDLLAFQIAIEQGQPGAVMCAYNRINGAYACENSFLLQTVLKGEWQYPGWVMSDWGAVHSLQASLTAGLDQESPQDEPYFGGLKEAVGKGEIPAQRVAEAAQRIVRSFFAIGAIDNPAQPGRAIDQVAHADVAERVALSGMVLLKNDGVLPLAKNAKRVAVIGGFADRGVLSGGGSSQVMPYGGHFLDKRGREGIAALLAPVYGLSSPLQALKELRSDTQFEFDDGADPKRAAELARAVDVAIVFATRAEEEGMDSADFSLPHAQDALIDAVASAKPHTVVVLETGNPTGMPWLSKVGAVLQAWYPGQRGGQAIAKILSGIVSPSGRLPMTFPRSADQLPRPAIPGFDPARRTPFGLGAPVEPFAIHFEEGSDVGYRWFERAKAGPLFAFGHGLTYTTFAYRDLRLNVGAELRATFKLTNTGSRPGIETAQLYAAPPGRTHRLVGWHRVELQPGESRTVTIEADPRLLASYEREKGWHRAAGKFRVFVGPSAAQRAIHGEAKLEQKHSTVNEDTRRS
ncbi:glycosyl hydrolase [Steroidobacter agaridevorans]|uniref:Glycosyl hydrolase n=1 Tax=Steroidobacter agaridevorans TaxID=2695856 RepID=A0A829YKE7_9GAMM|nr:glycoside hydrolase family 3 C-terminal domain-containing protein [Steroidobacter agaridevorans]GFE83313.1 glycosyl hydrolase [Steroidobacter agaridevorans]